MVVNFHSGCEKSGEILPTWQKDGVSTKFSVDSTTGSLLLVNSSMDDSGIYERDNLVSFDIIQKSKFAYNILKSLVSNRNRIFQKSSN